MTNGEWELRATRSWHEVVLRGSDDYSTFLYYEVTLRRRPSLLVLTVLLPMFILAVVNVFVFAVPSESGECCEEGGYIFLNALKGSWVHFSTFCCAVLTMHSRRVGTFLNALRGS